MSWRHRSAVSLALLTSVLTCGVARAQTRDRSVILYEGGDPMMAARAAKARRRAARLPEDPTPTPPPQTKRYWADPDSHTIRRSNLDGSRVEVVVSGLSAPYDLTYDEGTMQLVWTNSGDETVQSMSLGGGPTPLISSFEDDYAIEGPRDAAGRRVSYALIGADVVRVTQDSQSEAESREVLLTLSSPLSVHGLALSFDGTALYLGDAAGRMSQSVPLSSPHLRTLTFIDEVPPPESRPNPYGDLF